jgi:prepilin-type N-terminal cleavage/methylation domain-containing protein
MRLLIRRRAVGAKDERGLTLVELMIALVMIAVIMVGMFASVRAMAGAWALGQHRVGVQQHGRNAVEWMARRLRVAGQGWDVTGGPIYTVAEPARVRFLLNPRPELPQELRQWEYAIADARLVEREFPETGGTTPLSTRPLTVTEEVGIITVTNLNFCYFDTFENLLNPPQAADGTCSGTVTGTALGSIYRVQVRLTLVSGRPGESPITLVTQAMSRLVEQP